MSLRMAVPAESFAPSWLLRDGPRQSRQQHRLADLRSPRTRDVVHMPRAAYAIIDAACTKAMGVAAACAGWFPLSWPGVCIYA